MLDYVCQSAPLLWPCPAGGSDRAGLCFARSLAQTSSKDNPWSRHGRLWRGRQLDTAQAVVVVPSTIGPDWRP